MSDWLGAEYKVATSVSIRNITSIVNGSSINKCTYPTAHNNSIAGGQVFFTLHGALRIKQVDQRMVWGGTVMLSRLISYRCGWALILTIEISLLGNWDHNSPKSHAICVGIFQRPILRISSTG